MRQSVKKHILLFFVISTVFFFPVLLTRAVDKKFPSCLTNPGSAGLQIPEYGWKRIGSAQSGIADCDKPDNNAWEKPIAFKDFNLLVYTDGPHGSGRFWEVFIGIANPGSKSPIRGFCFETSTVGWRNIGNTGSSLLAPISWIDDIDKDGKPEVVFWSSFPMTPSASLAEYGLVAWVYELNHKNEFMINWKLTRKMARKIAAAYRTPLESTYNPDPIMRKSYHKFRKEIAQVLRRLVNENCEN